MNKLALGPLPMWGHNDFLFCRQLSFYIFQFFNLDKSSISLKSFYSFSRKLFSILWPQDNSNYSDIFMHKVLQNGLRFNFNFKFRSWILNSGLHPWKSKPGTWSHHASDLPTHKTSAVSRGDCSAGTWKHCLLTDLLWDPSVSTQHFSGIVLLHHDTRFHQLRPDTFVWDT